MKQGRKVAVGGLSVTMCRELEWRRLRHPRVVTAGVVLRLLWGLLLDVPAPPALPGSLLASAGAAGDAAVLIPTLLASGGRR